jgi:hypothetical protein
MDMAENDFAVMKGCMEVAQTVAKSDFPANWTADQKWERVLYETQMTFGTIINKYPEDTVKITWGDIDPRIREIVFF